MGLFNLPRNILILILACIIHKLAYYEAELYTIFEFSGTPARSTFGTQRNILRFRSKSLRQFKSDAHFGFSLQQFMNNAG